MSKYYISSLNGLSGISKYSSDFFRLVLKEKGYIPVNSDQSLSTILSQVGSRDRVHIELGIFQKNEINLLFSMLKANYKNVSVTLHDAPLIKYPFYEFKSPFLNNLAKLYDHYGSRFGSAKPYIHKIKSIYVLSHKGLEAVRSKYNAHNVYYLPHVVDVNEIERSTASNNNFIYFGFIGPNKGIEYSLQLHQKLLRYYPDIQFYIVGKPIGRQVIFYDYLRSTYKENVHYLGYIEEELLKDVFKKAMFAMQLFKNYKFFWPFSGSILYSLKKGKIVLTTKENSIPEIIEDGKNGYFLTGTIKEDLQKLRNYISSKELLEKVKTGAVDYLMTNHSPELVRQKFID
ncbi:MAG: glycosyltransferase family 4 protein [Chitinophagaceae bacterium]